MQDKMHDKMQDRFVLAKRHSNSCDFSTEFVKSRTILRLKIPIGCIVNIIIYHKVIKLYLKDASHKY